MIDFYPAIDIKNGKFIRLKKGDLKHMITYGNDPVNQAKKFCLSGAKWIHVVDIDGAFDGESKNMNTIIKIKKKVSCKVQVGGGIRKISTIEKYLNQNIDRIVLGTIALKDPEFVKEVSKKFPGKIALGLDLKNGFVAVEGWAEKSEMNFKKFIQIYEKSNVAAIIFTDIERDGLMSGANFELLNELLKMTNLNIILSGGISSLRDLEKLKKIKFNNLIGVISGKAIYEKKFSVDKAISILEN